MVTPAVAGAASASLAGPGVREGENLPVFHDPDFVAAFDHAQGEGLTVDVLRNADCTRGRR